MQPEKSRKLQKYKRSLQNSGISICDEPTKVNLKYFIKLKPLNFADFIRFKQQFVGWRFIGKFGGTLSSIPSGLHIFCLPEQQVLFICRVPHCGGGHGGKEPIGWPKT
jgi:hypothetical protein